MAGLLIAKFEQLSKIATNLLGTQEDLGDQITKSSTGIMRLTVSIKCIDAIWKDIITAYTKLQKLKDEIHVAKTTLPQVDGRMKLLTIEPGEDEEGNKQEAQNLLIYDPTDMDPGERIVLDELDHVEELEEGASAYGEATPISSNENTLVDEFNGKHQFEATSEDAGKVTSTTPPGSPPLRNCL